MNTILENILNRRTTRAFTEEKVDVEILKEIVNAGLYAPSSKNKQLWHFTVIQDQEVLSNLNLDTKEAIKKYAKEKVSNEKELEVLISRANNDAFDTFYKAPVAIIISKDTTDITSPDDCAVASQNLMLAAESFGLGSCWIGFIKNLFKLDDVKGKEYCEKFNIPENYIPSHAILIGHKKNPSGKASARRENTVTYVL